MRNLSLFILFIVCCTCSFAQKQKADSILLKYAHEKADTGKVNFLWMAANAANLYNPDTSLLLSQQALFLAQKIKYAEGESHSLGALATAFNKIGNYPKALEFYFQKLKIDESYNNHKGLASTYINIGSLYVHLEQYNDALLYYKKADWVIRTHGIEELEYYSNNNLGDVYERLNINDSAFLFFSKAVANADRINDMDLKGASMVGLGHIYLKQDNFDLALPYYLQALAYLNLSNDDDLVCEATLGIARLYDKRNFFDSSEQYALQSFSIAEKDGFQSRQLEAAEFLALHYKKTGNYKNALAYIEKGQVLKDSIYSNQKIRASQIISSNEQLRQNEITENKKRAEEERHDQLLILAIGVFIPTLFLITLLLSRAKIHYRVIRFLAIVSLLLFFEYILLLLNPQVLVFTNNNPVYEILVFAAVASILAPTHHRIENWLIKKLTLNEGAKQMKTPVTKPKRKTRKKPPVNK